MKKSVQFIATVLTAAFVMGALSGCGSTAKEKTTESAAEAASSEGEKIIIATSGSPNPFTYVDEDDNITGYDVEVVKAVFDKLPQYDYEIEITDWSSIFAGLDADKYQVAVNNISYNEERAEKYLYSNPILKLSYVIAVKSDNTDINSLEDLFGKSTEVDPDTTYTAFLEDYNEANADKGQIELNYSDEDLLLALQNIESGKYDFYLLDDALFNYYRKEYDLDLKAITFESEEMDKITPPYSYILVSKGNEQVVEDVNSALAELISDGTIKEISEKFFEADLTPYEE